MLKRMEAPVQVGEELKDYRAPLGAFQIISPDRAIFFLVVGFGFVAVFRDFLRMDLGAALKLAALVLFGAA